MPEEQAKAEMGRTPAFVIKEVTAVYAVRQFEIYALTRDLSRGKLMNVLDSFESTPGPVDSLECVSLGGSVYHVCLDASIFPLMLGLIEKTSLAFQVPGVLTGELLTV